MREFQDLIEKMEQMQTLNTITPACLAKIIQGAVAYARSFGFAPHPDYHHAAMLLDGLDPAACEQEFAFGRNGEPFYIQGPNETIAQAEAIIARIQAAGGHFMVGGPVSSSGDFAEIEENFDESDDDEDEDDLPGIPGGSIGPDRMLP